MQIQETRLFCRAFDFKRTTCKTFAIACASLFFGHFLFLPMVSGQETQPVDGNYTLTDSAGIRNASFTYRLCDPQQPANGQSGDDRVAQVTYMFSDNDTNGEIEIPVFQASTPFLDCTQTRITTFQLSDQATSSVTATEEKAPLTFSLSDHLPCVNAIVELTSHSKETLSVPEPETGTEGIKTGEPQPHRVASNNDIAPTASISDLGAKFKLEENHDLKANARQLPKPESGLPYPAVFDPSPYLVDAPSQPLEEEPSEQRPKSITLLDHNDYLADSPKPNEAASVENSVIKPLQSSLESTANREAKPYRALISGPVSPSIPDSPVNRENLADVSDLGAPIPTNPFSGLIQEDPLGLLSNRPSLAQQPVVLDDYRMISYSELVNVPSEQHYAFWTGTRFCHRPLYYEEACLERNGQCCNCQNLVSFGTFAGNILLFPYHLGQTPPRHCITTMGHVSPGQCVPCKRPIRPISGKGAVIQGLVTAALFL